MCLSMQPTTRPLGGTMNDQQISELRAQARVARMVIQEGAASTGLLIGQSINQYNLLRGNSFPAYGRFHRQYQRRNGEGVSPAHAVAVNEAKEKLKLVLESMTKSQGTMNVARHQMYEAECLFNQYLAAINDIEPEEWA